MALAVLLAGGIMAAVLVDRDKGQSTATTTVRGVIGSEKADFFADPDVVRAFADHGLTVRTETSGSWAMDSLDTSGYDFAFPSSSAPADALRSRSKDPGGPLRPFYSPLVVAAHRDAAEVLAANGLATLQSGQPGILRMDAYLKAMQKNTTWQQLRGSAAHSELTGTLFVTSTDPLSSNSGALYLAAASYVANGGAVVADSHGVAATAPLLHKLIAVQGAQQSSSDAPFRDFLSGVGNPLVLVYESQVASLLVRHQAGELGDLVLLYPDTTVSSDHTLVPFTGNGRRVGELLRDDPRLRQLAVRYGFRPQGDTKEFNAAAAPYTAYLNQKLTGVRQAPVPTSAVMHEIARRARDEK